MRATSSIARTAAARASAASSQWSWSSFSAAIARKLKPWRATRRPASERAADAQDAVPRLQRGIGRRAVAAGAKDARVVHVADGELDQQSAFQLQDPAHRRGDATECGKARIARELGRRGPRDERRVEARGALRVIANRGANRPALAHRLLPRELERVRAHIPVVAVVAVLGLQRAVGPRNVPALARDPGERVEAGGGES